jgi:hypothetical protein
MKLAALLLLFSLIGANANAGEAVQVKWRISYTDGNGHQVSLTEPDAAYQRTLKNCGLTKKGKILELVPAQKLRCPGLLDFSSSKALQARVTETFRAALAAAKAEDNLEYTELIRRLNKVDFGISPFGVFRSSRDGYGDPRRMGVNIASQNLVVLNKKYWEQVEQSDVATAFLIHEALGAAAYEDTDYHVSLEINELAGGRLAKLPKLSPQKGKPELMARGGDEGGITITGHGGDSDEQIFKLSLLRAVETTRYSIPRLDKKFWPSRAELRALVHATPVTIVNYFTLNPDKNFCRSLDGKTSARGLCGGFLLKGTDGKPFLLITRELSASPRKIQELMLEKIFVEIFDQLAEEKAAAK